MKTIDDYRSKARKDIHESDPAAWLELSPDERKQQVHNLATLRQQD
ncbi:MAG: hypothetical protein ABI858_02180 [Pseudoxanthomonas sp.]